MSDRARSPQARRFACAMVIAAVAVVLSPVVYHFGGRGPTATALGQMLNLAGTLLLVGAGLMRWRGPWREPGGDES